MFFTFLSRLPFPVLYALADVLYIVAYYLMGYRKHVVRENLQKAFPEKSPEEIQRLVKAFYRNLTDVIVEILKALTISKEEITRRVRVVRPEILQQYADKGQSVLALTSHQCNWEWILLGSSVRYDFPLDAVYRPLSNSFFDRLMRKVRSRFGGDPIPAARTLRELVRRKNQVRILGVVADQSPAKDEEKYWTRFLSRETAFYTGPDRLAYLTKQPVVFISMHRIKRGYYEVVFQPLAEPPYEKDSNNIVQKYALLAEASIRQQPANWLWSHRRWKHTKS